MQVIVDNIKHIDFFSYLFHINTQAKIYHVQSDKYEHHIVLGEFYDGLTGITDSLIETMQGKLRKKLKGYKSYPFKEDNSVLEFFSNCLDEVIKYKKELKKYEGTYDNIINQIQTLQDLVEQCIYKITFLP